MDKRSRFIFAVHEEEINFNYLNNSQFFVFKRKLKEILIDSNLILESFLNTIMLCYGFPSQHKIFNSFPVNNGKI